MRELPTCGSGEPQESTILMALSRTSLLRGFWFRLGNNVGDGRAFPEVFESEWRSLQAVRGEE
jgi:hypothetical protein